MPLFSALKTTVAAAGLFAVSCKDMLHKNPSAADTLEQNFPGVYRMCETEAEPGNTLVQHFMTIEVMKNGKRSWRAGRLLGTDSNGNGRLEAAEVTHGEVPLENADESITFTQNADGFAVAMRNEKTGMVQQSFERDFGLALQAGSGAVKHKM